jgi:hypothetical protein
LTRLKSLTTPSQLKKFKASSMLEMRVSAV